MLINLLFNNLLRILHNVGIKLTNSLAPHFPLTKRHKVCLSPVLYFAHRSQTKNNLF